MTVFCFDTVRDLGIALLEKSSGRENLFGKCLLRFKESKIRSREGRECWS
jgi:hypothetical protein